MNNQVFFYECGTSNLRNNLIAYYKFDGNGIESTGQSPNSSTSGTVYDPSGKINNAILFDSQSDVCDFGANSNFTFSNGGGVDVPFSISLWVNFSSLPARDQYILNRQDSTNPNVGWALVFSRNTNILVFNKFSNSSIFQGISISFIPLINTWYNIVFTDDGTKTNAGMNFYINGSVVSKSNNNVGVYSGMPNTNFNMRLGQTAWTSGLNAGFLGKADELGIWKNRAITQDEITRLYNSGAGLSYPF